MCRNWAVVNFLYLEIVLTCLIGYKNFYLTLNLTFTNEASIQTRKGGVYMLFEGGFNFWNFLVDLTTVFLFIMLIWILINVISDLFRRHDISGWVKSIWILGLILVPYLGAFLYLVFEHRGMAERRMEDAKRAQNELRQVLGFSVADELTKLEKLKLEKMITPEEYTRLRLRLVN